MPPTPGQPVPAQPTARSQEPVEIFRVGNYDGKEYPLPFLQKVVENFKRYQSQPNDKFAKPVAYYVTPEMAREVASNPSIGLGHENDQAILRWLMKRTDLPSAGFPTNLKLDGPRLMSEFEGMPESVAKMINGGELHTMSAEFYPDCIDEQTGQSVGPMLRRVSLLGGEIPKVKGLRLPTMVFTERRPLGLHSYRSVKSIVCFAEIGNPNPTEPTNPAVAPLPPDVSQDMDRQAMIQALQACGVSMPELETADDATLALMLKVAQAAKGGVATMGEPDPLNPPVGSATAPAPVLTNAEKDEQDEAKRLSMMAEACSSGNMDRVKAMAEAWFAGSKGPTETFAEPVAPEMTGDKDKDSKAMATFAEKSVKFHTSKILAPYLQSIGLVNAFAQDKKAETRQRVHTFCETLVRQGKITPFEMGTKAADGKPKPSIVDRLMSLDDDKKIITFGERKVSPRESWMLELEARPAVRTFNEKLGQEMGNTSTREGATGNQQPSVTSPDTLRSALKLTPSGRQALALHDNGTRKIDGL